VPALTADVPQITAYRCEQGFLDADGRMLFIGPEAERRFDRRQFMGLMAVFTAPPEFTVLYGRATLSGACVAAGS
jgi:ATP-dependent helicase Lhr and Lhr-like helicase